MFSSLPEETSKEVLEKSLKLLSPFTPHICDELWQNLFGEGYVSISGWPSVEKDLIDPDAEEIGELAKEIIGEIRKYKSDHGMPLGAELDEVEISVNLDLEEKIGKIKEDITGTGKIKNLKVSVSEVDSSVDSSIVDRFEMRIRGGK